MKAKLATAQRRPNGVPHAPVRSVRVPEDVWQSAKRRATYEGVTMSHVLASIVEGYAQGLLDLPKITVSYSSPKDVE